MKKGQAKKSTGAGDRASGKGEKGTGEEIQKLRRKSRSIDFIRVVC